MTIVIVFHSSGYRAFKNFCKQKVLRDWRGTFPNVVSYGRFVELMPWSVMDLVSFLNICCFGEVISISFINSTSVAVRHIQAVQGSQDVQGLSRVGQIVDEVVLRLEAPPDYQQLR